MSKIAIKTSQNVNINFTTASIGDRILAFIIDTFIKLAFLTVLALVLFKIFNLQNYFQGMDDWSVGAISIILTFPIYIYTLVLENLMEGQTFGKKLIKIRVVKIDGYQASFGDYLMRWFFNLVDIFSNSGIVGLVSIIVSKNSQRLGDMAAGTAVISLKNNVNISHTILENLKVDYVPTFPQVVALSDNDLRIIKENYQKAIKIDDRQVISRISNKIKNILNIEIDPRVLTEKQFINVVIKDYNFYTGKEN